MLSRFVSVANDSLVTASTRNRTANGIRIPAPRNRALTPPGQHGRLGHLLAGQLGDDLALAHHEDPVREAEQLLELGGDEQHTHAVLGERGEQVVDRPPGADVHAARRLVGDQRPRVAQQHAREQHLLLVAARQRAGGRAVAGAAHVPAVQELGGSPLLGPAGDEPAPAQRVQAGQADVLGHRAQGQQPLVLARLGDHRQPGAQALARPARAHAATSHLHRPLSRPLGAEDRARELSAPGSHEPGQADDLARPDLERDPVDPGGAEVADRQDGGRAGRRQALGRERGAERASEHALDELGLCLLGGGRGAHDAPVAQNRHRRGEAQHLAQVVRDEQHRRAVGLERADDLVQLLLLRAAEGGRRLVHHDQLGLARKRAQDLHLLLLAGAQATRGHVGGQVEPGTAGQRGVAAPERAAAQEAALARLGAEEHVLGDREPRHERRLLRDRRDAALERFAGRAQRDRLAREAQLPVVGSEHAGDDPPERRLAGAVLADQRVDLPARDGQRDGVEGAHAAEALGDRAQLDVCGAPFCGHSLSPATPR
jgi:hypothetical protein